MRVGKARVIQIPQFLAWLIEGREKNHVDLGILDYPTLGIYAAATDKSVGFLPVHQVAVLESLALDPEANAEEKLEAVLGMVAQVEADARSVGIRELHYLSSDERTDESAIRQLGFEKVNVAVYRKRL